MWIGERLEINGPQWDRIYLRRPADVSNSERNVPWWKCWGGHGSDEYGNCSAYFITALFGGVVFFYELPSHFQRDVELPEDLLDHPWMRSKGY
jgi:hypothetical protein